jgi:hypothetical protein
LSFVRSNARSPAVNSSTARGDGITIDAGLRRPVQVPGHQLPVRRAGGLLRRERRAVHRRRDRQRPAGQVPHRVVDRHLVPEVDRRPREHRERLGQLQHRLAVLGHRRRVGGGRPLGRHPLARLAGGVQHPLALAGRRQRPLDAGQVDHPVVDPDRPGGHRPGEAVPRAGVRLLEHVDPAVLRAFLKSSLRRKWFSVTASIAPPVGESCRCIAYVGSSKLADPIAAGRTAAGSAGGATASPLPGGAGAVCAAAATAGPVAAGLVAAGWVAGAVGSPGAWPAGCRPGRPPAGWRPPAAAGPAAGTTPGARTGGRSSRRSRPASRRPRSGRR